MPGSHIQQLEREHIEVAINEIISGGPPQGYVSNEPRETEWRVGYEGMWFNWRMIYLYACHTANVKASIGRGGVSLRRNEQEELFARLRVLGFPVERRRAPIRATDIVSRARLLDEALVNANADTGQYPLLIELDGKSYPADALLALKPGERLDDRQRDALASAGATLRVRPDADMEMLADLALRSDIPTEVKRLTIARIGQGNFRAALIELHGGCVLTGASVKEVLRASHIHRWADCADTPEARLDPENGLLLTATLDCLFEVGLISFADDGHIIISTRLSPEELPLFGITAGSRLRHAPSDAQRTYLAIHRERSDLSQ